MRKKSKFVKWWSYLNLFGYIVLVGFLVFQASLDGAASSGQSNAVGGEIADVINNSSGDQTKLVKPTSVEIKDKITTAFVGDTVQINATVLPENCSYKSLIYSSSNDEVAIVSSTGFIEFVSAGEVTFEVYNKTFNEFKDSFTVIVSEIPLNDFNVTLNSNKNGEFTEVTIDNGVYQLEQSKTYYFNYEFIPSNAVHKEVSYEFEDNNIITLANDMLYTVGYTTDSFTIKIKCENIEKEVKIFIKKTVSVEVELSGLNIKTNTIDMSVGQTINYSSKNPFGLSYTPSNASNKLVTYTSSDSGVVTVKGNNLVAKSKGEAIITITSKANPSISVTAKVVVKEIDVKSFNVTINKSSLKDLALDKTYNVSIGSISPSNASVAYNLNSKYLSFKSSDENVAEVSSKGVLTTKNPGKTTITVTVNVFDEVGNVKNVIEKSITVKVYQPSGVDDFDINTTFDNELPVIYNGKTYVGFKSNFSIGNLYYEGSKIEGNRSKAFTIELSNVEDDVAITYNSTTDELNAEMIAPTILTFIITHTESGYSKEYQLYCVGEIDLLEESNEENEEDINPLSDTDYEFDYLVSDNGEIKFVNANQSIDASFSEGYEKNIKLLESTDEKVSFTCLDESTVILTVAPEYKDIVFTKLSKTIKLNIKHKYIEDFKLDIHYKGSEKEVNYQISEDGLLVHCNNGDEFVFDVTYLPYETPTKVDLKYTIDDSNNITYSKGIAKMVGAGEAKLVITDTVTNVSHNIDFVIKNIIKLDPDKPFTIKQEFVTYNEKEHSYHVRNGLPGTITNHFTSDTTYKKVTYVSSNENIILVGDDGSFSPVKKGKADIIVIINDGISEEVTYTIHFVVEQLNVIQDLTKFLYKVRKNIGHFGAFLVLGILGTFAFLLIFDRKKWLFSIPLNIYLGFTVGAMTEYIQTLVPGRCGCWDDIWLDFSGFMSSTIVLTIAILLTYYLKDRKYKKSVK